MPNEERLEEIRRDASEQGVVIGRGVDVTGGPIPQKPGYYGEPVVRPPVWTWEIPIYFFVGGAGGMSAVIAAAAAASDHIEIAGDAMLLGAIAAIISPILLIMDLGRPRRFLNMLRVFKPQSAMSMGAWILTLFSPCVVAGFVTLELHSHHAFAGTADHLLRLIADVMIAGAAILGALLATYTGVLIGATTIPAWFLHRVLLPIHFGTAGLGSAAALLELLGHRVPALNALGYYAAAIETVLLIWLTLNRHGAADRAVHQHEAGWLIRIAEVFTGPLAIVLRLLGQVPFAAAVFLIGALASRYGWLAVGRISGCDTEAVFASQVKSNR